MEKLLVPGLLDSENETLNGLLAQIKRHRHRNQVRSSYYDAKHIIDHVGGVIPPEYRNLAFTLGWASKGVDGLGRRLAINEFVWPDGDLDDLGMRELDDSNLLMSELAQARTDALIHGTSFLTATRGREDEPAALVHATDALHSTGDLNPRTRRLRSFVSVHGWERELPTAFELYLPGLIISAVKSGRTWEISRSFHKFGVPVEMLTYRPRVSRRRGRSRITSPLMSYQDAAARALLRMEAHMDIYAIPQMIFLGAGESIFTNPDGTPKTNMEIMMGRILGIPDDDDPAAANPRAEAKQFSAQSPQPHLEQLNALAKLSARECDLPDSDFAMTDFANPTSEGSYTASRENLIAEAEGAQDDWNLPTRRTVARALAIQNNLDGVPAEFGSIAPEWRSPIYLSRSQQADAGLKTLQADPTLAGTRVGYKLLGLSPLDIEMVEADRARGLGESVLQMIASDRGDGN